jgi:hypothetical protein
MAMTKTLDDITPQIWRNVVLAGLRKTLVGELVCNKNFKQEIWGKGSVLNILGVGTLTRKTYGDDNITYEALTDSKRTLTIDQEEYVAFKDEDAERNNISADYLTEVMMDGAYQLADFWDAKVMAEYANAGLDSFATGTTPWQITNATAANIPALMGAIKRQLVKANAPRGDIYFIAPPEIEEAITLYYGAKGPASDKSDAYADNADYKGKFFGVNLFISNNCVTGTSVTHGLAGVMGTSIALAHDVITDEKLRLEGRIASGYRTMTIGGIKTYRAPISVDVNLNEVVIATS